MAFRMLFLVLLMLVPSLARAQETDEPRADPPPLDDVGAFNKLLGLELAESRSGPITVWSSAGKKDADKCIELLGAEFKTLEEILGPEVTWSGKLPVRVVLLGDDKAFLDLVDRCEAAGMMGVIKAGLCKKASAFNLSRASERMVVSRMGVRNSRLETHGMAGDCLCSSMIRSFPHGAHERDVPEFLVKGISTMVSMRHIGRCSYATVGYKKKNQYRAEPELKKSLRQWIKIHRSKKQEHDSLKKVINLTNSGFYIEHTITSWIALETLQAERSDDNPRPIRNILGRSTSKVSIEKILTKAAGRDLDQLMKAMDKWAGKARFQRDPFNIPKKTP